MFINSTIVNRNREIKKVVIQYVSILFFCIRIGGSLYCIGDRYPMDDFMFYSTSIYEVEMQ